MLLFKLLQLWYKTPDDNMEDNMLKKTMFIFYLSTAICLSGAFSAVIINSTVVLVPITFAPIILSVIVGPKILLYKDKNIRISNPTPMRMKNNCIYTSCSKISAILSSISPGRLLAVSLLMA